MPFERDPNWLTRLIREIEPEEESRFTEIPNFTGKFNTVTDRAVQLWLRPPGFTAPYLVWFPLSQLRRTRDGFSVYASRFIIDKKADVINSVPVMDDLFDV